MRPEHEAQVREKVQHSASGHTCKMSISSQRQLIGSPSLARRLGNTESAERREGDSTADGHPFGSVSSDRPSSAMRHRHDNNWSVSSIRSEILGADDNDRVRGLIARLHELPVCEDAPPSKVSQPQRYYPMSAFLSLDCLLTVPRQIVVIGNHTSGKSSLLGRLTGLSFPISRLSSTRFATEVTLRHEPNEFPSVKAYIVPGRTSALSDKSKNVLVRSTNFISKTAFDSIDFPEILEKVGLFAHSGIEILTDFVGRKANGVFPSKPQQAIL